jgi:hypothetical protein
MHNVVDLVLGEQVVEEGGGQVIGHTCA